MEEQEIKRLLRLVIKKELSIQDVTDAILSLHKTEVKNLAQPDVSGQLPDCNLRGKMHIIDLNVNKCIECGKGYSGNLR